MLSIIGFLDGLLIPGLCAMARIGKAIKDRAMVFMNLDLVWVNVIVSFLC